MINLYFIVQSGYPAGSHYPAAGSQYPAAAGHYPTAGGQYPAAGAHYPAGGQYQAASAQYPAGGQYPVGGQYPAGGQYPVGGQYPMGGGQPVVNNYYPQKSSGGSGLQTALIAGVGGLALYGALKPSEQKTIIIHEGNNATVQAPVQAGVPAMVPTNTNGTVPIMMTNDTNSTPTPLATYPSADMNTTTLAPPFAAYPGYQPNGCLIGQVVMPLNMTHPNGTEFVQMTCVWPPPQYQPNGCIVGQIVMPLNMTYPNGTEFVQMTCVWPPPPTQQFNTGFPIDPNQNSTVNTTISSITGINQIAPLTGDQSTETPLAPFPGIPNGGPVTQGNSSDLLNKTNNTTTILPIFSSQNPDNVTISTPTPLASYYSQNPENLTVTTLTPLAPYPITATSSGSYLYTQNNAVPQYNSNNVEIPVTANSNLNSAPSLPQKGSNGAIPRFNGNRATFNILICSMLYAIYNII